MFYANKIHRVKWVYQFLSHVELEVFKNSIVENNVMRNNGLRDFGQNFFFTIFFFLLNMLYDIK